MQLNKEYYFNLNGLLWALNKYHRKYLEKYLVDLDVTYVQLPYLVFLYYYKDCKQEDIAHCLNVDKCGVSRILTVLSNKGFVSREVDPNNRRSYILSLTAKGKEVCEEVIYWDNQWEEYIFKHLNISREDFDEMCVKLFGSPKNFVEFMIEDWDNVNVLDN